MKMLLARAFFSVHGIKCTNTCKIRQNSSGCHEYDVVVIGGGIIGTAIAKTIKEKTQQTRIALLEKESDLALHQSSHNSQVVHAGIHYRADSLKAKLCAEGANLIYKYCETHNIPFKRCGKLIIAKNSLDKFRLNELFKRGLQNNVRDLEFLNDWKKVDSIQPNCKGLFALWSPNSGNIDWKIVTQSFANDFKSRDGDIFFNCEVNSIKESTKPSHPLIITEITNCNIFYAKYAIICLGLHSGTLVKSDKQNGYKNISLHVNYYFLNPKLHRFIKTNIYAMPHLDMPFIGVHLSPTVDGKVLLGPNAVPTLKLDGYKQSAFDFRYMKDHVFSKEFGLLFLKNFQSCLNQVFERIQSDVRTSSLKKYFPMLSKNDIFPGPTAVQGQIVTNNGEFIDDFLIEMFEGKGIQKRIINCRFIPSPGATSSLSIAEMISSKISDEINSR